MNINSFSQYRITILTHIIELKQQKLHNLIQKFFPH